VVVGHESCGAVKATIEWLESGDANFSDRWLGLGRA
jgi:carbonic anhydrase